ncbi:MAG: AraC family transcriptional regulator [Hyphomicrobiales bacterium]
MRSTRLPRARMARTDIHNKSRYWFDPRIRGLSLLHADFTTHGYAPHSHEAFVVAVTETGGSVIKSRGLESQACASKLFVFNPVEPHAGWMGASRRWRYRALYLERPAIDALAEGCGIAEVPYFTRNMFGDADLVESFLRLHRALDDRRDAFRERELLIGSFGRLFRRHGSGREPIERAPRDERLLTRAIDLMRMRHTDNLRLDDVASAAGLTSFQLIDLFKRMVGLTPHAYLTQIRLHAACRRLRRGEALADIAVACGFYDQSALTKHFKRRYGITPLQFAKAARC